MSEEKKQYQVTAIAPQDLDLVWDDVKDYLQTALDRGLKTHTLHDIYLECASGRLVLWVISGVDKAYGACVATIMQWPQMKTCLVRWCSGVEFKHWIMALLSRIRAWAIMNEAPIVEVIGRRGWVKACGFTEDCAHMYMEA